MLLQWSLIVNEWATFEIGKDVASRIISVSDEAGGKLYAIAVNSYRQWTGYFWNTEGRWTSCIISVSDEVRGIGYCSEVLLSMSGLLLK